jgi:DNA-binding response OmpR family regulator
VNAKRAPAARTRVGVLIADDDHDTVQTLAALFADEGYVVHYVYRGDEVLGAVERYRPEVCVLDIEMPGKSGYAVAQELTARLGDRRPFLIAISGVWTRKSEQLLAESVGFHCFFTKPADPNALMQCVEEFASGGNTRP